MSSTSSRFEPGDRVYDRCLETDAGGVSKELIVVKEHLSTQANEYELDNGSLLSDAVDDWPPDSVSVKIPEGYVADQDYVVEVVFVESLDWEVGGEWTRSDPGELKDMCERNGVKSYFYHSQRLAKEV